jgi:hypothetical protein
MAGEYGIERAVILPPLPRLEDLPLESYLRQEGEAVATAYDNLARRINEFSYEQQWGSETPTQLTGDVNNYQMGIAIVERLTSDASRTLKGLIAPLTENIRVITNVGANNIVLAHQNASALAPNRMISITAADITMGPNDSVMFWYDITTARWREIHRLLSSGGSGTGIAIGDPVGSGVANDVLFVASGPVLAQSANFTWNDSSKTLALSRTGGNAVITLTDVTNSITGTVQTDSTGSGALTIGTTTNHPLRFLTNNTIRGQVAADGRLNMGHDFQPNSDISYGASNTSRSVSFWLRNEATATASLATLTVDANNGGVQAVMVTDGLGTSLFAAASGYIGTVTNHSFGIITNNAIRLSIDGSGNCILGNATGANRIRTSLSTPSSLSNGDWFVEASGTTPTRVISLMVRDGGVSQTLATITV